MKQKIITRFVQLQQLCFAVICFCLACTACTEKDEFAPCGKSGDDILLVASMPDDGATTKSPDQTKRGFVAGDKIHVAATFTLSEVGGSTSPLTQYAFMEFDGTTWSAADGTTLKWPWNATKATFTAYYIPGTKNAMKEPVIGGSSTFPKSLSEISSEAIRDKEPQDPLMATCTDLTVGSTVYLQFNHLCTKLTFINLDKVKSGQEIYITAANGLNNTFVFERGTGNTLNSTFANKENVSVMNKVETGYAGKTPETVTYLLAPLAAKSELKLSFKDASSYHSVELPEKLADGLEAGKHYKVDITKLSDSYMDDAFKEENWSQEAETVELTTAGINQYLQAIRDGQAYIPKGGKQVLQVYEEEGTKVVAQLVNVDFNNQSFTPVNLSRNIIFQGNSHSIKNIRIVNLINENVTKENDKPLDGDICGALFGVNAGTIKNLILEGVKTDFYTTTDGDKDGKYDAADLAFVGTLAAKNSGTIQNVKVKFTTADNSVTVEDPIKGSDFYQGGLVGYNTGKVENVQVSGAYSVTVSDPDGEKGRYIGGLIGLTSKVVKNCQIQAASTSTVKVKGGGTLYVGGFSGSVAGGNSDLLSESSTNMNVDATGTTGTIYAGGFTGSAANKVEICSATGAVTVTAGQTVAVGGFIGQINSATLNNCHASGAITQNNGTITTPYIGGFAGQTSSEGMTKSTILNCSSVSAIPAKTSGFISTTNAGDQILNSFSSNNGGSFITTLNEAIVTNCHHNGDKTVDALNTGTVGHTDWLEWTATPAIYGTDIPYLKR